MVKAATIVPGDDFKHLATLRDRLREECFLHGVVLYTGTEPGRPPPLQRISAEPPEPPGFDLDEDLNRFIAEWDEVDRQDATVLREALAGHLRP